MAEYDFTTCLSPLDFELLSKDLLEAELGIQLENFSEGRDKGIDLRCAPIRASECIPLKMRLLGTSQRPHELIVQCKRYSSFANLKSELKNKELAKIAKLNPARYVLTTSVSLSPQQADELKSLLSPFVLSTGDIYGKERLNSLLTKHQEIERRHVKLWVSSAGILDSIINAGTHVVSREEVERTIAAARIYVHNDSFDEALSILKQQHVCIISGQPGIGKTTLARMLLLYFYERGFDVIRIESDISEARAVSYHNRPRFYYYDDFLGQTAQADKLNKNEDQKILDFMASVRDSKDSVFVLTTREYILNQACLYYERLSREKFDRRTCIIDLSKYSRRIRAQILYNHVHFSDLPRMYFGRLIADRGYVQIVDHENYNPRLVEYLTNSAWVGNTPADGYLSLFLQNLDNPVEIWGHAFRNQLSDRARHVLFVLTTMPTESRMIDIEQAFMAFHSAQCTKRAIARRSTDFMNALKELDGTFLATRKVGETVLVRFQNPSIRDFMRNVLLGGELLPEIIESLVFFEQAQWFVETLNEEKPSVVSGKLAMHASMLIKVLQGLAEASGCSFSVVGSQSWPHISPTVVNPVMRLATIARAISTHERDHDNRWVIGRLSELAAKLEIGKLSPSFFVGPIKTLQELGYLESAEGKCLVAALKLQVVNELSHLGDFEILAHVISTLPELLDESEVESVREAYSAYADQYAIECDLTNPEEIREEASRVSDIGVLLDVDVNSAEDILRDSASKMERDEESDWNDDFERYGRGHSDSCSDGELDSMFRTLGA